MKQEKSGVAKMTGLILFILSFCQISACRNTPPENPNIDDVTWATYTNSIIGCSLQHPNAFTIHEDEDKHGVIFRHHGSPVLLVRYSDEKEGNERGLWFGHEPQGETELSGKTGEKYVYRHYDGPFFGRTVSYVIPHRGKYLGLEFRTENETPDKVQQQIIDSFRINNR